MPAYYVTETGNNSDGLTWAKAFTTFAGAVTAATGDGDIIYVDQGFTNTLSANTTYTFSNNVRVICSNDKVNEPPQTLGTMGTGNFIGNSSTTYNIILAGAYKVYFYGITFRLGGTGSAALSLAYSDGSHFEFESCYFYNSATGAAPVIHFGDSANHTNHFVKLLNCTVHFDDTGARISVNCPSVIMGGSLVITTNIPSDLFYHARSTNLLVNGMDLSALTTTLVASSSTVGAVQQFANCKLGSGVTILATQTPANKSSARVWLYNCSADDQHYHIGNYDAFGSTVVDTGIYANDGAQYDGTNRCSWKIVTTANCSYYTPYVSLWIDCYHSGTSAITPSLEIVRSGSATAYQNDEVWGEFSYQGTSGFPLATIVSDRKALLAAAADQTTGALDASGWTGENATSWFGKLNPTSAITPAEIGHLRARVVVGEPSITVYVDPTIRGRS